MNDADAYQDAYNHFLLNNFDKTLKHLNKINSKGSKFYENGQIIKFLSYIALSNYDQIMGELKEKKSEKVYRVLLALIEFKKTGKKENFNEDFFEECQESLLHLVSAIYFLVTSNEQMALRVLNASDNLFCDLLRTRIYLKMNRLDLARATVDLMNSKNEDSLETMLAQASLGVFEGDSKNAKQGLIIFQEVEEKYGKCLFLTNCIASAMLALGDYENARLELLEVEETYPNNEDVLINFNYIFNHYSTSFNPGMSNIDKLPNENALMKKIREKALEFDQCGEQFA